MKIVNLYKYTIENGIRITPKKPDEGIEYTIEYRLIADEGNGLTKNESEPVTVIDVDNIEGWEEVPAQDLWETSDQESEEIK